MTVRYEIAYALIALLVIAAILGAVIYSRKLREARRVERGGRRRR